MSMIFGASLNFWAATSMTAGAIIEYIVVSLSSCSVACFRSFSGNPLSSSSWRSISEANQNARCSVICASMIGPRRPAMAGF